MENEICGGRYSYKSSISLEKLLPDETFGRRG
jgi:hypothetical protein